MEQGFDLLLSVVKCVVEPVTPLVGVGVGIGFIFCLVPKKANQHLVKSDIY